MDSVLIRIKRLTESRKAGLLAFSVLASLTVASLLPSGSSASGASGGGGFVNVAPSISGTAAKLSTSLSQTKFVQGADGRVFLTVDLSAPVISTSSPRTPVDMVVVLDRSGSMAEANKLPLAKNAITDLARRLNAEDRLALITFDNSALVQHPLAAVTDQQRNQIERIVSAIQPGGSTNISDGLSTAFGLLHGASSQGRTRKILLLSDGQANLGVTDPGGLNMVAARAKTEEAMLSTIGMGLGFNEIVMSSMADYGMGTYGYLEHLGRLNEILASNLEDARNVYARASELHFSLGDGVTIIDAAGYPLNRSSGSETVVPLGQILSGSTKHVMLTLSVPTNTVRDVSIGSMKALLTRDSGEERIDVSGAGFQVAVLAPELREEAVASINSEVWKKAWTENNLGMMRRDVAAALRSGDKDAATKSIAKYKSDVRKNEEASGISMNSPAFAAEIDTIGKTVEEAFSGGAAQQSELQNRYGKELHQKALSDQRSN